MNHTKSTTPFIKTVGLIAGILIGAIIMMILLSEPLLT